MTTPQLIGPLYTNVTYLGVCMLSVLYPRMTTPQLIGPLYTNVTYLGVCMLSVLYPRMTTPQLIGPLYTNVTYLGVCMLSVLYPRMTTPQLIGPLYTNVTYLGAGPFIDVYFICRVSYQQSDDDARFDVFLTFDSRLSSVMKTTTSSSLDVTFTSQDVIAGFGTKVLFRCYDRIL